MDKVLVIFRDNWADEMDVEGFWLTTKKEYQKALDGISETTFEVYFGTNEYNEYEGKTGFLSNVSVFDLTDEEAAVIAKVFELRIGSTYGSAFGDFPFGAFETKYD